MIKKYPLFLLILSVFLFQECTRGNVEQTVPVPEQEVRSITLTLSLPDTKSSYSETGKFSWSEDDDIAVYNGEGFSRFALVSGAGTGTAVFKGELPVGVTETYALFPYDEAHKISKKGNINHSLPSVVEGYVSELQSDIPMYAAIPKLDTIYSFIMTAAAVRFKLSNLQAGVKTIVVSMDKPVTGFSTLSFNDTTGMPALGEPDGLKSRKYILKQTLSGAEALTLDVPVTPLTYGAFAIDFFDEESKLVQSINFLKEVTMLVGHIKPLKIDCGKTSASTSDVITVPHVTKLPTLVINTPGKSEIVSKEEWMESAMYAVRDTNGNIENFGMTSIKGRGNSTWILPKKPYNLKFDKKDSMLGMNKHKRWVLLANYIDKTLIRNAVAFEIARHCDGLEWTPDGRYVEVILNGKHVGNYYLCEQIKIDSKRVNISEEEGQILNLDLYYDETYKFKSEIRSLPYMFKDPDVVDDVRFSAVQDYVNEMERSLYDDARFAVRDYLNYLDENSLIDQWFVFELTTLFEPRSPRSVYMYKDGGGKLYSGPVWDFDLQTFYPSETVRFQTKTALYYERLFEDTEFKRKVRERWEKLRPSFEQITTYIDEVSSKVKASETIDRTVWPYQSTKNNEQNLTFDQAVARLKQSYIDKLSFMDDEISRFPKPYPTGEDEDTPGAETPGLEYDDDVY